MLLGNLSILFSMGKVNSFLLTGKSDNLFVYEIKLSFHDLEGEHMHLFTQFPYQFLL
jgi:hypothetical protein